MRASHTAIIAAVLIAACRHAAEPPVLPHAVGDSRRSIESGDVIGFTGSYGSHVWLGIPYAKPPVGELRWRSPAPPERWSGVREALAAGPACPQFPSRFAGVESDDPATPVGDEDCLYLNVYAPPMAAADRPPAGSGLPVMLWIHGGGNVIGHGGFYDGGNLAATHRVVVVTTNYRLGPLGWFRHSALRASAATDEDRSGNYGTLDLVRALEWVRDNVAAFGGDPGNVTIFGESAGGRDVFTLLLSPKARGLFHRAVVQSGGTRTLPLGKAESFADASPAGNRNSSNEILLRLLRADGRAASRAEAKEALEGMKPADVERYLRGQSAPKLLSAYRTEDVEGLIDVPQIFRDGKVIPAGNPLERLRRGEFNDVPTIFGTNRDEDKVFLAVNREYVRWLFRLIPLVRDHQRYEATARHLANVWRANGVDRPAALIRERQGARVWSYRFDWDEEPKVFFIETSRLLGAAHGFEIPFVFGHWHLGSQTKLFFDESNEENRKDLSAKMMSYWAEFAHAGDPGTGRDESLPRWRPYDPSRGAFLVLDTGKDGIRMESGRVTVEDVIAAIDRDPDLPTPEAKCEVYRRLVEWKQAIPRERYPKLASGGCADFPLPEREIS